MEPEYNSNSYNNLNHRKTIFKCDLEDGTLRECVQAELKGDLLKFYIDKPYDIIDPDILNCLDAGLVACLRPKLLGKKYLNPVSEIIVKFDENNMSFIEEINVSVNLKTTDKALLKKINNCLNVFRKSCRLPDIVKFLVIEKNEFDTLQKYKTELKNLEEELRNLRGKKENLYNIFKIYSK